VHKKDLALSMFTSSDKKCFFVSLLLVPAALALMKFHTVFTLLTVPFCFGFNLALAAVASRLLFKKEFVPASGFSRKEEKEQKWSDYLLTWLAIFGGILLLFLFGAIADFIRDENVWIMESRGTTWS